MSEWFDNQKKPTSDCRNKISANKSKRRKLTAKEKSQLEHYA
tara:strand:+ start:331 stop:456 length:126 start_codon:yes stop_codon:yes gene_type:complete